MARDPCPSIDNRHGPRNVKPALAKAPVPRSDRLPAIEVWVLSHGVAAKSLPASSSISRLPASECRLTARLSAMPKRALPKP